MLYNSMNFFPEILCLFLVLFRLDQRTLRDSAKSHFWCPRFQNRPDEHASLLEGQTPSAFD